MKTHLSFSTQNLQKSIAFYRTLLDAQPAKSYGDYALFITEDPGLELALDQEASVPSEHASHYGLAVDSVEAVDQAIARLQAAGLPVDIERDETCCYAKQTKVWVTDPDGRRWETYYVLEDTPNHGDENMKCCQTRDDQVAQVSCC